MNAGVASPVLSALMRAGVKEFCVCGGARNAPLVVALVASRGVRMWNFPEERCAGFFGLGRTMATGMPVAVVTTSGTAAAELLPAAIEARYQGRPLVLVTADRPERFRGSGAPQAIDQPGLFGGYVSDCIDVTTAADANHARDAILKWNQMSPLHVNLCLEEPSGQAGKQDPAILSGFTLPRLDARAESVELEAFISDPAGLVVLVGALDNAEQPGLCEFLEALGAPVYAEAQSGFRERALAVPRIRHDDELRVHPVRKVLRIGGVPAGRFWRDLEDRREIEVLSITRTGFRGLARASSVCGMPDWRELAGRMARSGQPSVTAVAAPADRASSGEGEVLDGEPAMIRALSEAMPEKALVFLGNSLPIREWNAFATHANRGLRCFANRGANGIDGALSTFFGLSADEPESWCVVGDLTALYDLAAPWILRQCPVGNRRLVIINNGGGKIFRQVSGLTGLDPAAWRVIENPHQLDFEGWAAMWGMEYRCVREPADLMAPVVGRSAVLEWRPKKS